jgi:hypothetical protein
MKILFSIISFLLLSCSTNGQQKESFYLQKDYIGYIILLHENYNKQDSNDFKERIFEVNETGLVLTREPYKNLNDGLFNREVFIYKDETKDRKSVIKIGLGNKLQLCDNCSEQSKNFEGNHFFHLVSNKIHNNVLNVNSYYSIYLTTDRSNVVDKTEAEIYGIVDKVENYFFNYNSKIIPYENNNVHEDLKMMIYKANADIGRVTR